MWTRWRRSKRSLANVVRWTPTKSVSTSDRARCKIRVKFESCPLNGALIDPRGAREEPCACRFKFSDEIRAGEESVYQFMTNVK